MTHPDTLIPRAVVEQALAICESLQRYDGTLTGAQVIATAEALRAALQPQAAAEPVAWKHDCAALCMNGVKLWIDRCPHCGKPRTTPPATQAALTAALEALKEIASMEGTESNEWDGVERVIPEMCAVAKAAIAQIEALGVKHG